MTPDTNSNLVVSGLTKSFGPRQVLKGIAVDMTRGESLAILGPNGAGKTTFLRILATLSRPNSGEVRFGPQDLLGGQLVIKRKLGFVSHRTLLYDHLTPRENLEFYGRMYEVPDLNARIQWMLQAVGLVDRDEDPVRTLSRGMQQRLAIARALLHEPTLVLLDEPFGDLDQQGREMLLRLLAGLDGEEVVITATSDLEQAYTMGQSIAILVDGRLVYQEKRERIGLEGLRNKYKAYAGGGN